MLLQLPISTERAREPSVFPSLTLGNHKLGKAIHAWSITPGKAHSCVGETAACSGNCYAKHGFFIMPNVAAAHAANLALSKSADFVRKMRAAIFLNHARTIRIHVAGDFYSRTYVDKWFAICRALPDRRFFAYTRSWQDDKMLASLTALAHLPNFQMWWSCDVDTGEPVATHRVLRAYMATSDFDVPPYHTDLIFRTQRRTVVKRVDGVRVCPAENGLKPTVKLTCSNCGLCWDKNKLHHLRYNEPYYASA